MSEAKVVTLKEETIELSSKIRAAIKSATIDPETGGTKLDKEFIGTILPEGLTVEHLQLVNKFQSQFVPAASNAWGEEVLDFKQANKDNKLNDFTLTVPVVGKDEWVFGYRHAKNVVNPQTKETSVKFGNLSAKYDLYATGDNGEFAKVKELMTARASSLSD